MIRPLFLILTFFAMTWFAALAASSPRPPSSLCLQLLGAPDEVIFEGRQVLIRSPIEGVHGAPVHVVQRRPDHRWDNPSARVGAHEGSVSWMIKILGPKAARFWGYEQLSADRITVPSAEHLNIATALFNTFVTLHHPQRIQELSIPISFVDQAGSATNEMFFRSFVESGLVPISTEGSELIHDVSYHVGQIFYPPHVIQRAQNFRLVILHFVDEALVPHLLQSGFKPQAVEKILEKRVFAKLGGDLDTSNGNLVPTLVGYFSSTDSDRSWIASNSEDDFRRFAGGDAAIETMLIEVSRRALPDASRSELFSLVSAYVRDLPLRSRRPWPVHGQRLFQQALQRLRLVREASEKILDQGHPLGH